MTETEKLREALQNCLGLLDTPIARRKIGIDPNAEWLRDARELSKAGAYLTEAERRIFGWDRRSQPEIQNTSTENGQ